MLGFEALSESPLATLPSAGGGATAYSLTCSAGAYTYTGVDATLTYTPGSSAVNYTLTCDAGAYAYTGNDATLIVKRNYVLTCDAGAYAYSGKAATLTYISGIPGGSPYRTVFEIRAGQIIYFIHPVTMGSTDVILNLETGEFYKELSSTEVVLL